MLIGHHQQQQTEIILVGDIGGTNCRLNLWRAAKGEYELLSEQVSMV